MTKLLVSKIDSKIAKIQKFTFTSHKYDLNCNKLYKMSNLMTNLCIIHTIIKYSTIINLLTNTWTVNLTVTLNQNIFTPKLMPCSSKPYYYL